MLQNGIIGKWRQSQISQQKIAGANYVGFQAPYAARTLVTPPEGV